MALEEIFSEYGTILEVVAKTNLKAKGQAFIVFDNVDSATRAIEEINGFDIFDKPMILDYAKTRSDATVQREGGSDELEAHKRKRLAEKGMFDEDGDIICRVTLANLSFPFTRAQASPRGTRSTEETQASCPQRRAHTPGQDYERRWPQAHLWHHSCCHSRRVPPAKQDPVLAGPARRCQRRGSFRHLWPLRGIPGSQIGTWSQGNCLRRVRSRDGSNQRKGGYIGYANGRARQGHSRYLSATVVVGGCIPQNIPDLVLSGVWKVSSQTYLD